MKKKTYQRMACVFALLFSTLMIVSAKGGKDLLDFYYSNMGARQLQPVQIICVADKSGKYLTPHLKYHFTYDQDNRVVKKEAFRWNSNKQSWQCEFHLRFTYLNDTQITEYAKWDCGNNLYDHYSEKAIYRIDNKKFTAFSFYKRDKDDENWQQIANLEKIPVEIIWLGSQFYMAKNE